MTKAGVDFADVADEEIEEAFENSRVIKESTPGKYAEILIELVDIIKEFQSVPSTDNYRKLYNKKAAAFLYELNFRRDAEFMKEADEILKVAIGNRTSKEIFDHADKLVKAERTRLNNEIEEQRGNLEKPPKPPKEKLNELLTRFWR